jgi:hypothetical protein
LQPTRPLAQPTPLASLLSRAKFNLAGPASPRVDGVFVEVHFPFWFAPSELAASLLSLCQVGPGCRLHLLPRVARPRPCCRRFPSCCRSPRCPLRTLDAAKPLPPPITPLPSNRALTHRNEPNYLAIEAPPSTVVTPPSTPQHTSLGPIKATPMTPRAFTHHRAPLFSSPAPELLPTELPRPPPCHRVARSPHHRPSSGEARAELPALCCAPAGEL